MTYTLQTVRTNLAMNQAWLERAIIRLYERQTQDEKSAEQTKHLNAVGFNSPDARRLSYYARYIQSGRHLSGNHLEVAKKMVPKYARQILEIINQGA